MAELCYSAEMLLAVLHVSLPSAYVPQTLEGWKLVVERKALTEARGATNGAMAELKRQLQAISRILPDSALAKVKRVPIWIHTNNTFTTCMAYHPGAGWLTERGLPAEMAKCIEIGSLENFQSWTYEQPWMVLHELAHAYHDQFCEMGFENPAIKSAFEEATASKRYESVLHWNGSQSKHYASTNPMEYFAELTEAYFGTNDFFPFHRAELMNYDPAGFRLMESVWGKPVKRITR